MIKATIKGIAAAVLAVCCSAVNAGVVTVWGETRAGFSLNTINNFYNGLAGHSSSIAFGNLDTVDLSSTDLLWATQPANSYTANELNTMASFISGGGRIAFMGEHGTFAPNENNRINAALAFLGSTISINNVILDSGFRSASVGDGQILNHPLTEGVDTYQYAAFAPLTLGANGEALMLGEQLFNGQPSVMMGFENIGDGSIFLITDQNVWDNAPNWPNGFDNARLFENLLSASTVVTPPTLVPAPGVLMLMALGLLGMAASRRMK